MLTLNHWVNESEWKLRRAKIQASIKKIKIGFLKRKKIKHRGKNEFYFTSDTHTHLNEEWLKDFEVQINEIS